MFYQVPYRRQWRIALADVFDVFLAIKQIVNARVAKALKRDQTNYRVLEGCPPCSYEVCIILTFALHSKSHLCILVGRREASAVSPNDCV